MTGACTRAASYSGFLEHHGVWYALCVRCVPGNLLKYASKQGLEQLRTTPYLRMLAACCPFSRLQHPVRCTLLHGCNGLRGWPEEQKRSNIVCGSSTGSIAAKPCVLLQETSSLKCTQQEKQSPSYIYQERKSAEMKKT